MFIISCPFAFDLADLVLENTQISLIHKLKVSRIPLGILLDSPADLHLTELIALLVLRRLSPHLPLIDRAEPLKDINRVAAIVFVRSLYSTPIYLFFFSLALQRYPHCLIENLRVLFKLALPAVLQSRHQLCRVVVVLLCGAAGACDVDCLLVLAGCEFCVVPQGFLAILGLAGLVAGARPQRYPLPSRVRIAAHTILKGVNMRGLIQLAGEVHLADVKRIHLM